MQALHLQVFQEAFLKSAQRCLSAEFEKAALSPTQAAKIVLPRGAAQLREALTLGRGYFEKANQNPDFLEGIYNAWLHGPNRLSKMRELQRRLAIATPGAKGGVQKQVDDLFREIGTFGQKRDKFMRKTAPVAAGVAAGGAGGFGVGKTIGTFKERRDMHNDLSNMPMTERLRYLFDSNAFKPRMTTQA